MTRTGLLLLVTVCLAGCADLPASRETASPSAAVSASPHPSASPEREPSLVLRVGDQRRRFTRSELLRHPKLVSLRLEDRSGYEGSEMTFKVVPLARLFEGLRWEQDQTLRYDTLDGFSSSIDPERLLNESEHASTAYLAIEDPHKPWPNFPGRDYGAGPFYVVWERPELSDIGREEWPFKLKSFRAVPSIAKRFPKVLPEEGLEADHPVKVGFEVFLKNCFPCHTLNGQGTARFGPDLNEPLSPTEYFAPGYLKRLVRDPQSLRRWSGSKMTGFPPEEISDEELDALVAYLGHMAERRRRLKR